MKKFKEKAGDVLFCLLKIVIGILLFIDPVKFTSGILVSIGVCLAVIGVFLIVHYFMLPIEDASKGKLLMRGLIMMIVGSFAGLCSKWIIASLPILTIIYGVIILISALEKLQNAIDSLRMRKKKGWISLIGVAVSLICVGVILLNPFTTTNVLWAFTGISIIIDAVFDVISVIFAKDTAISKGTKNYGGES